MLAVPTTSTSAFTSNILNPEKSTPDVHIRIHQRKTKCYITSIEGLTIVNPGVDLKKLLSSMKKQFSCNGYLKHKDENDEKSEMIISLTGDQRENVKKMFIEKKIVDQKIIKIHGF